MPSERHIKLELPGNSLINCFGIQPTFLKGEVPERISLFSLGRYTKWRDNATTNSVYYTPKLLICQEIVPLFASFARKKVFFL